jgi:hypothetical protein
MMTFILLGEYWRDASGRLTGVFLRTLTGVVFWFQTARVVKDRHRLVNSNTKMLFFTCLSDSVCF